MHFVESSKIFVEFCFFNCKTVNHLFFCVYFIFYQIFKYIVVFMTIKNLSPAFFQFLSLLEIEAGSFLSHTVWWCFFLQESNWNKLWHLLLYCGTSMKILSTNVSETICFLPILVLEYSKLIGHFLASMSLKISFSGSSIVSFLLLLVLFSIFCWVTRTI